jgi:26S proteasome non-ATPase regulatory subunit 9
MEVIEKAVHAHFEFLQANPLPDTDATKQATTNGEHSVGSSRPRVPALATPFARVNSVVAGSPAEQAGLKEADLIRNFGYVNRGNHDELKRVAECVQGNEGVSFIINFPLLSLSSRLSQFFWCDESYVHDFGQFHSEIFSPTDCVTNSSA